MFKFRWNPLLDVDGDIGAAAGSGEQAQNLDQSSVATGDEGSLDAGTASVSDSSGETVQTDVTQQASFANRLSEERKKLEQQFQPHVQTYTQLEQLAKQFGFESAEDYLTAVNEQAEQQRAAQEAQRMQLDPETYNQFFAPVKSELQQAKKELERLKQADLERQIRVEYDQLSAKYPDFKDHQDKVFELAGQRFMKLEEAYKLVAFDARVEAAKLEAQQQTLANVTARGEKQVLAASDKGVTPNLDPASMSLKDIEAISARVRSGERITL